MEFLVGVVIVLNLVGVIWLGIVIEHWFLTLVGYIIALGVIGSINENAFVIVLIAFAGITLIASVSMIISAIVRSIKDKKINKRRYKLESELKAAIERKDKQTVENILKENLVNNLYIDTAVESGDKEIVSLLLTKISNINNYGGNILVTAIKNSYKEIVSLLLEKGANVNLVNDGKTPLDFAKDEEIITLLRNYGGKTKEEIEKQDKIDSKFKQALTYWYNEKTNPKYSNALDNKSDDTKNWAEVFKNAAPFVSNIDLDYMEGDVKLNHVTPLMMAVIAEDLAMIKVFVEHGADVNAKRSDDASVLELAIFSN
ncbi:MAG: hypothetical protein E7063_01130, partial [Spirochaetaceae bacterium]|nr:hypothetical protein [Spirochaetaceae bacterium]